MIMSIVSIAAMEVDRLDDGRKTGDADAFAPISVQT
jgi:hypothetical protein